MISFFYLIVEESFKEVELCLITKAMLALIGWTWRNFHLIRYPERVDIASRHFTFPETKITCTSLTQRLHVDAPSVHCCRRWVPCSRDVRTLSRQGPLWLWASPAPSCSFGTPQLRAVLPGVMASYVIKGRKNQDVHSVNAPHKGDGLCGNASLCPLDTSHTWGLSGSWA